MMKWSSEKLLIKKERKREKLRISENREHKFIIIIKLMILTVF